MDTKNLIDCHQDVKGLFQHGFFPFLTMQIAYAVGLTGTLNFLLSRLDQTKHIASLIRRPCTFGPSFLGRLDIVKKMFDKPGGNVSLKVADAFGFLYFSFLVGVKIDMDMILKANKRTYIIGFFNFIIPLIFNTIIYVVITNMVHKVLDLQINLKAIVVALSVHSFHDTSCALDDLNLLNSEIGRLSLSISIFTGVCSWSLIFVLYAYMEAVTMDTKILILALIALFILIIRPVLLWMIRTTPEGTTLKESYIALILIFILVSAFYSEVIGLHFFFIPVMIGMVVPVGTLIGEAVQKKLECFITMVLLPATYLVACSQVNVFNIQMKHFAILELLIFLAFVVRLVATILQCRPYTATSLLRMRSHSVLSYNYLDIKSYAIAALTKAFTTIVSTPVVKRISDPSRRYAEYRRRTIRNSTIKKKLRILACVYSQENVPSILNFLEATNPTKDGSVCIYVLHLVELVGRAASLLVEHDKQPKQKHITQSHSRVSEKINNAFDKFEQRNRSFTIAHAYTAVAPFAGMYNNVCDIILDKRINMVIIPFGELAETPIRAVNQSILQKAPCTVGILFDHINRPKYFYDVSIKRHNIAMIFIGGPDDREALTYCMRISNERNLRLTVFRFTHPEVRDKNDDKLIKELRKRITRTGNIVYKEEEVRDCGDTASKIKVMEEAHDFILVGRQHDNNSPILLGLYEWCVYKELGVIGDLLVTSNFKGNYSVLIVKQ
ncbi:hypothetical protein MKX03_023283 [Papaver bracteatum]|nr:hypothetical protein MKX03_023283 [Papaver bracteatum]